VIELLLVVIAALLACMLGVGGWLARQVYLFLGRLVIVETEQHLCPGHFKPGGSD
jgi:hypothetical protein